MNHSVGTEAVKKFLREAVENRETSKRFNKLGLVLSDTIIIESSNVASGRERIRDIWRDHDYSVDHKIENKIFKQVEKGLLEGQNKFVKVILDADRFEFDNHAYLIGRVLYNCSYETAGPSYNETTSNTETDGAMVKRHSEQVPSKDDKTLETLEMIAKGSFQSAKAEMVNEIKFQTMGKSLCQRQKPEAITKKLSK